MANSNRNGMAGGNLKGHLALLAAYTIFGVNIVLTKDISNSAVVSPIALFTLRAIGASALFWLISLFTPKEKVPIKDLIQIALASIFGLFITQYTFLKGIMMATTIDASIIGTLGPIFTMFFAFIFVKEPITAKKAAGVGISFIGIIFLIFNSVHSHNGVEATQPLGFILLFLNSISFSLYLGAFRPLIQRYSVITFMKWMFLFSLLMSLPLSFEDLLHTDYAAIKLPQALEIGYLIFFATFVAYFLIPVGQKSVRPTIVAMYTYLQPILACLLSVIGGMDTMTWQKIVAIIMVFSGVAVVNRSRAASHNQSLKHLNP